MDDRFLRLVAVTLGPALDVAQLYFECGIIPLGNFQDLQEFLNDSENKHTLFHECFPNIPCCGCPPNSVHTPSTCGCLKNQFSKLYDQNNCVNVDHEKTRGQHITQHCLCRISAKQSVKVTDMDILMLNAIIRHCCPESVCTRVKRWMDDIKKARNTCMHWGGGIFDEAQFDLLWKNVTTAILLCAGDIGDTSLKIFQKEIDKINKYSLVDFMERNLQNINNLLEVFFINHYIKPTIDIRY